MAVAHRVEEISQTRQLLAEISRAVDRGEPWTAAEVLHTFAGVAAVECTQGGLAAKNDQLRRALTTRDTIGQAKGMLMERFDIDAAAAFDLLVRLSQDANVRLELIARKLIDADRPPPRGAVDG